MLLSSRDAEIQLVNIKTAIAVTLDKFDEFGFQMVSESFPPGTYTIEDALGTPYLRSRIHRVFSYLGELEFWRREIRSVLPVYRKMKNRRLYSLVFGRVTPGTEDQAVISRMHRSSEGTIQLITPQYLDLGDDFDRVRIDEKGIFYFRFSGTSD